MTLSKFIKQLRKLEAAGHGRAKMTVDKDSLWDGNQTCDICNVESADYSLINRVDGDGFIEITKAGTEIMDRCIVIRGKNYPHD